MSKALVVTLHSGEAEFDECVNAIKAQKNVLIEHVVISGLGEFDAHNELLKLFQQNVDKFDIYVKVDADTVIKHENAFDVVFNELKITHASAAQLPLYDYFTCRNIMGLNFYDPKLNDFKTTNDRLFCDRSIIHHGTILYAEPFEKYGIVPVGLHCMCPTDIQSFHFGYHRGLKKRFEEERLTTQWANKTNDRARKLASIGFEYARTRVKQDHEYTAQQFNELFCDALKSIGT